MLLLGLRSGIEASIPNFMVRAIVTSIDAVGLNDFIMVQWPENI